jgi:hypothetical protein
MFRCFRTAKGMALLALAVVVGGYFVIWHQLPGSRERP